MVCSIDTDIKYKDQKTSITLFVAKRKEHKIMCKNWSECIRIY